MFNVQIIIKEQYGFYFISVLLNLIKNANDMGDRFMPILCIYKQNFNRYYTF